MDLYICVYMEMEMEMGMLWNGMEWENGWFVEGGSEAEERRGEERRDGSCIREVDTA